MPGPVLPPSSTPAVFPPDQPGGTRYYKTLDIITQAMIEIGALDPNEVPRGPEANNVLIKLNRMIDSWNADGRFMYGKQFVVGNLTPNLQPHLIGPTGTTNFVYAQRPIKILDANILLNYPGPTTVRCKVKVQDDMWWANNLAPAIQSVLPTDLYYQPDWPNGSMFLWVVPTVAYPLELEIFTILSQLELTSSFSLPPGYMDAVVYSLAMAIAPSFDQEWPATLEQLRKDAIRRIQALNITSPRLGTCDAGIPGRRAGNRANYNYISKQFND